MPTAHESSLVQTVNLWCEQAVNLKTMPYGHGDLAGCPAKVKRWEQLNPLIGH
jgi:hypothetical protein